jgi:hypothetical protein
MIRNFRPSRGERVNKLWAGALAVAWLALGPSGLGQPAWAQGEADLASCYTDLRQGGRTFLDWAAARVDGATAFAVAPGQAVLLAGEKAYAVAVANAEYGVIAFKSIDGEKLIQLSVRGARERLLEAVAENDAMPDGEMMGELRPLAVTDALARIHAAVAQRLDRFADAEERRLRLPESQRLLDARLAAAALVAAVLGAPCLEAEGFKKAACVAKELLAANRDFLEKESVEKVLEEAKAGGGLHSRLELLLKPRDGGDSLASRALDAFRAGSLAPKTVAGFLAGHGVLSAAEAESAGDPGKASYLSAWLERITERANQAWGILNGPARASYRWSLARAPALGSCGRALKGEAAERLRQVEERLARAVN